MYAIDQNASDSTRVVLTRPRRIHVAMHVLAAGVGVPISLTGIVLLVVMPSPPLATILIGSGLFVAAFAELISAQFRAPRRLVFDNDQGQLRIDATGRGEAHTAVLPYGAIEGFRWLPFSSLSGAGHGTPAAVVEMTKHNGAVWILGWLPTSAAAQAMAAELRRRVVLSSKAETGPVPASRGAFQVHHDGDRTEICWGRRFSMLQSGLLSVAMMGITGAVVGARPWLSTYLYYGGLSCAGLIASLSLYGLMAAALRRRCITIDASRLKARCGGGRLARVSMPRSEIDTVLSHFSPTQRDSLLVLRAEERERLVRLTRGPMTLERALSARALSAKAARIEVGDLTMPDKLNLEQLVYEILQPDAARTVQ